MRRSNRVVVFLLTLVLAIPAFSNVSGPHITLSSSASTATAGTPITLTATISGGSGNYTGHMRFAADGQTIGYGLQGSPGSFTFKTNQLAPGTHTIQVNYYGDAGNIISVPSSMSQTINGSTVTTLSVTPNPANVGNLETINGVVTTSAAGAPSGSILVTDLNTSSSIASLSIVGSQFSPSFQALSLSGPLVHSGTYDSSPQVMAIGDVDGDGIPDLVWIGVGNLYDSDIHVSKGNGDGTFGASTTTSVDVSSDCPVISSNQLVLADVNDDGHLDVIKACSALGVVRIHLGNGDGTFSTSASTTLTIAYGAAYALAVGDFNNDGEIDLAIGTQQVGGSGGIDGVVIYAGNGTGAFTHVADYALGGQPRNIAVGDFDENGCKDLAVSNTSTPGPLKILYGNCNGTFNLSTLSPANNWTTIYSVAVADINRDGHQDIVASFPGYGVEVFRGNGVGLFSEHQYPNAFYSDLAVIDVNGDGYPDIIGVRPGCSTCGSNFNVMYGTSSGTYAGTVSTTVINYSNLNSFVVGDLDGGGLPDVVIGNGTDGTGYPQVAVGLASFMGGGTFQPSLTIGSYQVSANYPGDTRFMPSTSSTVNEVVQDGVHVTVTLTAPSARLSGQNVDMTAAVSALGPGTPTGSVAFYDNSTLLGTVALSGLQAHITDIAPALGSHTMTAIYFGDATFNGSSGVAQVAINAPSATIIAPSNGATNVDASAPINISWTSVASAQAYYLYVGTTPGAKDVYASGETANTSVQLSLNGHTTYYLRLFTKQNNGWPFVDSTFTTGNIGKLAVITSPANGATNIDSSSAVTVSWSQATNVATYYLYVGTTVGGSNVFGSGEITATSSQVKLQPTTTYYCRIFTKNTSNGWAYTDSSFSTGSQGAPAAITAPSNGATNVDGSVPISVTWNTVTGGLTYYLYVGTTVGATDVFTSGETTGTSASITRNIIPSTTYYLRLFTKFASGWKYRDTTFTTGTQHSMAFVTSPSNGANNVLAPSVTITWNTVTGTKAYFLYVGTTVGARDVYATGETLNTQATVNGLSDGTTYYLRMWTKNSLGVWHYNDSTFTTAASFSILATVPTSGQVAFPSGPQPLGILFSDNVDPATVSVSTVGTSCTGTIQLSSDGFNTCVAFLFVGVNGSNNAEVDMFVPLAPSTAYLMKINGVKSVGGASMSGGAYLFTFSTF